MSKRIDITGMRSGKLVAIKNAGRDKNNDSLWLCQCDCGSTVTVVVSNITGTRIRSCGCLNKNRLPEGEAALNALYSVYKSRAKKRGRVLTLSKDEFRKLTSSCCEYCGAEPSQIHGHNYNSGSYIHGGIDRIDSSIGYVLSNCVPCCWQCNRSKCDGTKKELLDHALRICEHNAETSLV